jgi:hypothetical protein
MNKHLINHIVFVVDESGSMQLLSKDVVKVFDSQIQHLAQRSQELDQETRVSVYLFNYSSKCIIWDRDVLRLPSLSTFYRAAGGTSLIDATILAIDELKQTPELHCDHAFLAYVLTDGGENGSSHTPKELTDKLSKLSDNWTVAALVPDESGKMHAETFGFPLDNIQIWSTTEQGIQEVGATIRTATENFMQARAKGVRSTKSLFNLDVSGLSKTAVKTNLTALRPNQYRLLPVHKDVAIKPFVEKFTKEEYRQGSGYYQLTKKETIQNHKQIVVQEKSTGKIFSGPEARTMLGLPSYEVKVAPDTHNQFNIFVQSTSVNRKLVGGTNLIVLK